MTQDRSWMRDILILIGLSVLAFCTYGVSPLLTPDEGRYAELAREMLTRGQFIIPHLNSIPYFEKPPLIYWLTASGFSVLGWSEWAARFWCVVFYVMTLIYTYAILRVIYTRKLAMNASLILGSSLLFLFISHMLTMDFGVAFFINMALLTFCLCIHRYSQHHRMPLAWLILAYVFIGCAVMSKGLIGLIFPALVLGLWVLIHRKWRLLWALQPILGLVIVVLVSLPWLLLAQQQYSQFLHFYIWVQQFARYLTPIAQRSKGRAFYPLLVFIMIFPWCGFWVEIFAKIKWLWQQYSFFIVWAAAIIVFFAFSHSILIPYLMPVSLPLAVLVGACLDKIGDQSLWSRKGLYFVTLCLFLLLSIAFVVAINVRHITVSSGIWAVMALFVISVVLTVFAGIKRVRVRQYCIWILVIFLMAVSILFTLTAQLQERSVKSLALFVKAEQSQNPAIKAYSFVEYYQDLPFYLKKDVYIVTNSLPPRELQFGYHLQHKHNPHVVLTKAFVTTWHGNTPAYAFVKDQYLTSFKALFPKGDYCLLQKEYRIWLVGNKKCT